MYRPYYVPPFKPNLNLPYEYKVPSPEYQTSPWYIASTYDINRVPTGSVSSSYTYGIGRDEGSYDINRVPTGSVPSSYTYGIGRAEGGHTYV
jgi:hypothetical protein